MRHYRSRKNWDWCSAATPWPWCRPGDFFLISLSLLSWGFSFCNDPNLCCRTWLCGLFLMIPGCRIGINCRSGLRVWLRSRNTRSRITISGDRATQVLRVNYRPLHQQCRRWRGGLQKAWTGPMKSMPRRSGFSIKQSICHYDFSPPTSGWLHDAARPRRLANQAKVCHGRSINLMKPIEWFFQIVRWKNRWAAQSSSSWRLWRQW